MALIFLHMYVVHRVVEPPSWLSGRLCVHLAYPLGTVYVCLSHCFTGFFFCRVRLCLWYSFICMLFIVWLSHPRGSVGECLIEGVDSNLWCSFVSVFVCLIFLQRNVISLIFLHGSYSYVQWATLNGRVSALGCRFESLLYPSSVIDRIE